MPLTLLSIIYFISFIIFIYTTIHKDYRKYRPISKTITSIIFVVSYIVLDGSVTLMIIALFLCMLGDLLLGITKENKKIFMTQGMISFLSAHIIYIYLMCKDVPFIISDIIISLIGLVFLATISSNLKMELENKKIPIYLYTFIVFMMGGKALSILIYSNGLKAISFGIGGILFLISDIILLFLYFKYKNNMKLQISNSILYYLAQYLMVIAFII